jgi:hypothetical protein
VMKTLFFSTVALVLLASIAATDPVHLGLAGNYAILSKTAISTVPTSAITGDIAVSPIAAAAITGFVVVLDVFTAGQFATAPQVTGKVYAANFAVPTPATLTTAVSDMEAAYTNAAGRDASTDVVGGQQYNDLKAGLIGGETMVAGVYTFGSDITITDDVTFNGTATDVFIIRTTGFVWMAATKKITLTGGVKASNIFWQVATTVYIGAGGHMEGIILAKTAVTFITGSSLNGRILGQTSVALQSATITQPLSSTVNAP